MKAQRWQAYAVLGVGVSAVAWAAILVREADAPVLIIAAYRLTLASIPMGALALWQQRRAPEPTSRGSRASLGLRDRLTAAHVRRDGGGADGDAAADRRHRRAAAAGRGGRPAR